MSAAKVQISKDWLNQEPSKTKPDKSRKIHKFEQMRITRSEDLPELMTTTQAAEHLGKHYKTIEEYRRCGDLKFFKIKGRYFTTPEFIQEFIEAETSK